MEFLHQVILTDMLLCKNQITRKFNKKSIWIFYCTFRFLIISSASNASRRTATFSSVSRPVR